MSQFTFGNIDETATDGFDLAAFLEEFESAVNSGHSGPTAPVYAIQGMTWRDTSNTPHLIKVYDGSTWCTTGEINATTHVYKPWSNGAVLGALSGYGVGDGLEVNSSNLRIKLDGSSLSRSSDGLKVAAKGIQTSHIFDAADGSLWTWDANGNAYLLAPGTAGQVLTSDGAGALPYWAAASAGLEFIGSTSLVGVNNVTLNFDSSTYKTVMLFLRNLASSYDVPDGYTPYYTAAFIRPMVGGSVVNWSDNTEMRLDFSGYLRPANGVFTLYNPGGNAYKHGTLYGVHTPKGTGTPSTEYTVNSYTKLKNAGQVLQNQNVLSGIYINTSYINASGGPPTFVAGEAVLYGIKN